MQVGLRPRLKARPSLVELLVRAGAGAGAGPGSQSDPPRAAAASSPPLFSAGTAPASDRQLAVLEQAANLPLPPSPETPLLSASAPPSPTPAQDTLPTIVI